MSKALAPILAAVLHAVPAVAQTPVLPASSSVLAVPYVAQTELLCGGAAVEMALRYWGESDFRAERFASLIEPTAGGIATDVLARATAELGWEVLPFRGDVSEVRRQLGRGRPVLALIQVATGRFHYVTVVGSVEDRLIYHDPAVSSYEIADIETFERAWAPANRWAMLILPEEDAELADGPPPVEPPQRERPPPPFPYPPSGCSGDIEAGVAAARSGRERTAEEILTGAAAACPHDGLVHRELAALRLQQGRYSEARRHAERAWNLARDPQTMRLLAAARYLDGHDLAALDAWNALAPLRVDWVNFLGISRTNARRIVSRADLGTQEPLSAERLRTARRRVAQLPTLSSARVDYAPTDSGRVEIDIAIDEKRRWPMAWSVGVRAAWDGIFNERVRLEAAGPLGLDERWSLEYRWETARRRVEVGLEVPGSLFVPGVWRLEGGRERDSFATAPREERRGLSLGFSSWLASRFRMGLAAGWERFTDRGSWLSVSLAPTLALDGDRLIVRGEAHGWTDLGPATNFARLDLEAHWQSNPEPEGLVWRVRAGAATATALSPRSLWPGAGDGTADVPLLRAHRLAEGGVIDGPIFGRRLVHGGIESTWWGIDVAVLRLGAALFTDVGLAGGRPADAPGRGLQVDAGLGLRIDLPDVGRLRLDLARGLVDEALRLSAGLERDWEIVP